MCVGQSFFYTVTAVRHGHGCLELQFNVGALAIVLSDVLKVWMLCIVLPCVASHSDVISNLS